ncbi:MAG: FAD-dependent oxidoreductase [Actinobacteria bacterium]|nr:FAD-dependent oxidoreductase [Actinomycetota bacterium]
MARTPLAQRIEDAYAEVVESRTTRRELVKRTAVAGAALAGASTMGRFAKAAQSAAQPQIAVVGAGLAGLTCAYRLKQAGLNAQVYEANPERIGGRCWTITSFADGQIAEHGGELIDQGHTAMRQLSQELGFTLDNLLQAQPKGTEDFFYVNGAKYPYSQLVVDLNGIYQKMHKDVSAASYPTLWNLYTQRGFELDHMSITDWLNETIPNGGASSNLGRVLDIAYNIEYGAECSEQSALNLLYLLGYSGQGQFRVFGPSNEKYHVKGGNDQIPTEIGNRLSGQIRLDHVLTAIKQNSGGSFTLTFQNGATTRTTTVDHVVLAIPFSMLREVNYSKAGFERLKVTAIRELAMGTNSKLHVQFKDRFWYIAKNNGNTYADTGYQNTWEVTRAQSGGKGILVDYTGGTIGASFGTGTPQERGEQFINQLAPQFPGIDIGTHWDKSDPGTVTVDYWAGYPWSKGSYSYWKVGQYTKFSGMEKERQGNCHFCGEHTSQDFQGYLNGGVETGERAAGEILGDLKHA